MCIPNVSSIQDKGGGDASTGKSHNLMVIDDEQPPVSSHVTEQFRCGPLVHIENGAQYEGAVCDVLLWEPTGTVQNEEKTL